LIYPTPFAVVLAVIGAPVALLVGVFAPALWPLGLVWIAIVVLLLAADAFLGADRRKLAFELDTPTPAFIGSPVEARAHLAFPPGQAPRMVRLQLEANAFLRPRNRVERALGSGGRFQIDCPLETVRRGPGKVEAAWATWTGPLGLVSKRRIVQLDQDVPIVPDIRSVKREAIRIFARDTTIGQKLHIERGAGSEFDALREFLPGMDRRTIDWKQSARHTQLLAKEFRTEQDQTVVFAIDTGRLMSEPAGAAPKLDVALNSALLLAYVSLRLGDRVALFGFDAKPNVSTGAVSGVKAFPMLQRLASRLDYSAEETNYTLGLTQLSAEIQRRSLIVVFTDFADPTSAELMIENVSRLMKRHLVLFVAIRDADLERLTEAEPQTPGDVSRAVIAHSLMLEKDLVLSRLQRLGAEIVSAPADRLGPEILNRYVELKRQSRI
jgi:uncharacterized protein (DUF58 family)